MYKNRSLIDRIIDTSSVNVNTAMTYRKLVSLIKEYNIIARDKGLPVKNIPAYNDNMNCSLMLQSVVTILKDIDRIGNINEEEKNEEEKNEKILTGVTFENNTFTDSIWVYTKDNDNVRVTLNVNKFSERFTGNSITLDYTDMPYEKLIATDRTEYLTVSYKNMFSNLPSTVTTLIIHNWTNKNVTDMTYMFSNCSALTTLTLGDNFNTSSVTDMRRMFYKCSNLTSLTLGDKFDTSSVTNMRSMFSGCSNLTSLTLGDKFDTSSVTDMTDMLNSCSSLTSLTLGTNFNTSSVTNISGMFYGCSSLTSLTLGDKFDTSSVTDMRSMFARCSSLTSLTLGTNFNTSSVTLMIDMFSNCSALTTLTLGDKFDTSSVTNMTYMFSGCSSLTSLTLGANFVVPSNYGSSTKVNLAPAAECTITMNKTMYDAFKQYDLASYTFSPASWDTSGSTVQTIIVTPPSTGS